MPWTVQDRRNAIPAKGDKPFLTDEMKKDLTERYIPRYPTRRAVLLPALHHLQEAYGHLPMAAIQEVAEFLGLPASEALDTASFYDEFTLKPRGQYTIGVCRSLACELCGSNHLTDHLRSKLKIEPGETTPDGRFTLIEMECLGACGTGPAALVNEVLHEDLTPEKMDEILAHLPADPKDYNDPDLKW